MVLNRPDSAESRLDPALALLADALQANQDKSYVSADHRYHCGGTCAAAIAATEPGTRLLAALRDGLAVAEVEKEGGHLFCDGPDNPGWSVDIGKAFSGRKRSGQSRDTLHAAVAAALAPETSEPKRTGDLHPFELDAMPDEY